MLCDFAKHILKLHANTRMRRAGCKCVKFLLHAVGLTNVFNPED